MRCIILSATLLSLALSFPIPVEKVEIEGVGEIELSKLLNLLFPNSAEVKLFSVIIDTPEKDVDKYDQVFEKHKDFKNFNEILDELKKLDPAMHAKIEPLYQQNRQAYLSLTGDAKAYMDQYLDNIWTNLIATSKDNNNKNEDVITREQGTALKKKFDALTPAQKESIKSKFPMLTYFISEKVYEKD